MGQRFENSGTNRAEETGVPERITELAAPAVEYIGISKRLAELPPFPAITLRLLTLSTEAVAAVDDFESAFRADPALATELLLSANSVEFGLRARVESIRQAIMLLGLERVNLLSVTIAMRSYMRESPRLHVIQPLWLHGIATAVIAETLGNIAGLSRSGLYTAGLVHDIGRLGLLSTLGQQYAKRLVPPTMTLAEANAAEREQFGIDHAEAGAVMVRKWNFPELLCQAVRHHHDSSDPSDRKLRQVQMACRIASALGYGEHAGLVRPDAGEVFAELPPELRGHEALEPDKLTRQIGRLLQQLSASH